MATDWRHFNAGYMDASRESWKPGDRTGRDLVDYKQGYDAYPMVNVETPLPPNYIAPRPEPGRAEVAMRIMERLVPVMSQNCRVWSHEEVAKAAVSCADALRAALARKENA